MKKYSTPTMDLLRYFEEDIITDSGLTAEEKLKQEYYRVFQKMQ